MKTKLLLIAIAIQSSLAISQTSSNSCTEANSATAITSSGTYTVGTINGTSPTSICIPSGTLANKAVWFAYTPTIDTYVKVTSDLAINGNKDTRLNVFTGGCASLNCVAGNDDVSSSNYKSEASFAVNANQTYYIVWDNRWSTGQNFSFEVLENQTAQPQGLISFTSQYVATQGNVMGVVDMNGDHLDDIVSIHSVNGTYNVNLYYQQTNGTFVAGNYITTANRAPTWSLGAGDYDGNGFNDLAFGDSNGVNILQANATGTAYTVVADNPVFTQRINFVDIDNDGSLDVFVCHDTAPSIYYMNDGQGQLTYYQSVVNEGLGGYPTGGNYGSVWVDYDNDGDVDMFMAKCGGNGNRPINEMYRNDGNGNYTEVGAIVGLNDRVQTWSAAWADFNNDGWMDCFVGSSTTSDGMHRMMLNVPNPDTSDLENPRVFVDITESTGINDFTVLSLEHIPGDFNNDGYVDIYSGGRILINNGDMTFSQIPNVNLGTGSVGDLNNDGFLDIFTGSSAKFNSGNNNNWLKIVTIGNEAGGFSNRGGIGARIEISSALGTQIRDVRSGEGFRYMHSLNTHFGLGEDTAIDYIRVTWPSGVIDNIPNPSINQTLVINEGTSLGLPEVLATDLIVYPNPVKDMLHIKTKTALNDAIYTVFDINGRRVLNSKLLEDRIDVSSLSPGTYILRLVSNNTINNEKFIKH